MGLNPTQIQQLGLIGNAVLWNGQAVTLVQATETGAIIATETGSFAVSLTELDLASASHLISTNEAFLTPGVFRPQPIEAAVCSSEDHDYTLDACLDPTTEEGRSELLRQAASTDEDQREQAVETIRSVLESEDEEVKEALLEDLRQLEGLAPREAERARQTYSEAVTDRPHVTRTVSEGSRPVPHSGGGASVADESGGVIDPTGDISIVTDTQFTIATNPTIDNHSASLDDAVSALAVVAEASVPVALGAFALAMPAFLPAAAIGMLTAPRSSDVRAEAGFFQTLFDRLSMTNTSSGLVDLLTHPTPEFAPKVYEVRRAVADVVRIYRATYGPAAPFETPSSIPISFRYDAERRRIEVAIRPSGSAGGFLGLGAGRDREGRPSSFSDLVGSFRSLSLFRLGSDDHRAGPEFGFGPIIAYVPVPQQYLQGVRVGDGAVTARADGRATDRGVERMARRDSANDEHGGSRSGDGEGRGSRGDRDGRGRHRRDEQDVPAYEDELETAAA